MGSKKKSKQQHQQNINSVSKVADVKRILAVLWSFVLLAKHFGPLRKKEMNATHTDSPVSQKESEMKKKQALIKAPPFERDIIHQAKEKYQFK